MVVLLLFCCSFLISLLLLVLATAISKSSEISRLKSKAFECGFDVFTSARVGFSLHFYMVALIFLVFDVEIALLLPLPLSGSYNYFLYWWVVSCASVVILIVGLAYEWKFGALSWM